MIAQLLNAPYYYFLLGLLCGIVGFRLGWRSGNRWALPLLQALLGFVAFAAAWRMAGPWIAALAVAGWAVGGTIAGLSSFRRDPGAAERRVLRAARYREEMLTWLRSGRGFEARPLATARAHLVELLVYVAAAAASANFLGLVIGAVLLNFMNGWVATLFSAAHRPWTVRLLAWNSWSLLRVAAYILLGSACAAPLAALAGFPARQADVRALLIAGGAGVLLDFALKLLLSRSCGRALAGAVDLESVGPVGAPPPPEPGGASPPTGPLPGKIGA